MCFVSMRYTLLVIGEVFDASNKAKFHIYGTWDEKIHRDVVTGKLKPCVFPPLWL